MIAHFFIHRPIFAWVISIVIMLTGIGSILNLPVEQYPDIAPPTIRIDATYTGASAETVENSVVQIIEQQLMGLDGLLYFSSSSSSAGKARISVTFEKGTDPDTAQVQVQNKVAQITTRLPKAVQNEGVRVTKAQSDFLMIVSLYDTSNTRMSVDVADYLLSTIQDPIARLEGVGTVQVFGAQYAMRIWVDPYKLAAYNLMPSDVSNAVSAQNVQVSAGSIGALPSTDEQQLNATVTAKSQYQTPAQFENIIVKSDSNGAIVRLKDVARVELGSESYTTMTKLNGYPASGLAIVLAPGANALATADRVKTTINKMKPTMPEGYEVAYPRDSTKFIRISIEEVVKTLFEAIILVVVVMFVFLQNWRATLIPAIAVPVVLLGTFGVLEVFGYSINTLTMFGMVLSIGLLVDDAIVVVENVERIMREEKLSAMEATEKSMREITSALVGIATVLSAVFLPMAFFSGSTGVIYRQFSITIVSSMVLSVIVALTLTPAMCASLLTPHEHTPTKGFFGWFNRTFDAAIERYKVGVGSVIATPLRWMVVYGMIALAMAFLILRLPSGFLPDEDQGNIMVQMNLPEGASFKRTNAVAQEVERYFLGQESHNTEAIFTISGFNYSGNGQNAGMAFVALNDWDQRKGIANRSDTIASRATKNLSNVRDARIFSLNPPAIRGLGQTNGFTFQLQALADTERETLKSLKNTFLGMTQKEPLFTSVRLGSLEETPQLNVKIDEDKAVALGLSLSDIDDTLSYAWAGKYVNDFVDRGRIKKVYVQGDAAFRSKPEDLDLWYVQNKNNVMTPFSAFATTYWSYGAQSLTRYNGLASYEVQGAAAQGVSSGVAMDRMEELQESLPLGTSFAWSGLSYQERLSSGQTVTLYSISILVVFLCLAALYESWSVPFSVLLVIPLGIFGAVLAAYLRGLNNDVYFQVALLTTIGLSSKNAILIVEFAEMAYTQGKGLVEAAVEGSKLRLRPILMTSLAFIAGVLPLALSSGAGANSRISIGTGIIGGTLSATFLAIFLVPLFFVLVRGLFPKRSHHATMVGEV